jgi:hypothetical protein
VIAVSSPTEQQQRVLDTASTLSADPKEIDLAIQLMRTGRADLLVAVTAQRMTIRAALALAKSSNQSSRVPSRAR